MPDRAAALRARPPRRAMESGNRYFNRSGPTMFESVALLAEICAAPGLIPVLFFEPAFTGREAGVFRLVGWIMAVVGLFLWIGGRSGARALVAAGIVVRLAVPIVAVPLAIAGVFPHMMWVFGVLDPVSGVVTWRLMTNP